MNVTVWSLLMISQHWFRWWLGAVRLLRQQAITWAYVDPDLCRHMVSPGGCFTNVSRALQNILSKFVYYRNHTSYVNFKLKLCTCAQSHALGTHTKFQLEILTINVISGIVYFREIILESSRNVSETTPRPQWLNSFINTCLCRHLRNKTIARSQWPMYEWVNGTGVGAQKVPSASHIHIKASEGKLHHLKLNGPWEIR